MRVERIDNIIEFVYKNKNVTLDQICDNFNISKSTVRRDLSEILKDSNLQKTYGGITLKNKSDNRKYLTSFNERNIENIDKTIREKANVYNIKNGKIISREII